MPLKTVLTRKLRLRYPIVVAPLGRGSTPEFLGTLAHEGALSFVALGHFPETELRQILSGYIASAGGADRFGVNLVLIADQMRRLETALDAGCRIVSLLRGDPAPYARRAKDAGATVFWTVSGPDEAERAADLGVDFIVAQGREAGGHLTGEAPLMTLLPAVIDAAKGIPVVAAGGIADGRGLAAALTLGACGAWMGTRFVASEESGSHPGHKQMIVISGVSDLVETTLFDGGWPNSPHRVIANSTYQRWREAGCPPSGSRPGEGDRIGSFPEGGPMLRYNVSTPWDTMDGDWEAGPLYAGTSTALIRAIEPAGRLLERIDAEAEAVLRRNIDHLHESRY
ncbi:MAG: nitronate monooxygenase [Chthoniobacterales bacterium]|nr:nitronate monooxygenase [Chthoniobacterales bacterium]